MEGFKPFKKVQCFKEGGSVQKEVHNFTKRDRKNVNVDDTKQDKAMIKKAFAQHDKSKHGGSEPTEIKLKKGGRAKKEVGTVKKYKTGGTVENAYGAKKTDKDIKDIANSKNQKPALLCGGGKAYKKGGKVKKMAAGGPSFETDPAAAQAALDTQDNIATRNIIMNPARKAKKYLMDKLSGLNPMNAAVSNVGTPAPASAPAPAPAPQQAPMKKGGKVKKYASGGSIDDDVRSRAMKWIESGSPEQSSGETPKPKKAAAKLPMPDYSNEDLDRIDAENAEYERKRESRALANRKSAPKFSATRSAGVRDVPKVPDYAKEATGYKRGGKAKK